MYSTSTDPELRDWLRWASESARTPMFARTVAEAPLFACVSDYELLRPVLLELKRLHPGPRAGPAAPGDPELRGWLCWASSSGHVPSFVRALVEAAFCACTGDYALLRSMLLELRRRYPQGKPIPGTKKK
jgi:hypothetical protein